MNLTQTLRRTSALAAATLILGLGAGAALAHPPGISGREAAILRASITRSSICSALRAPMAK